MLNMEEYPCVSFLMHSNLDGEWSSWTTDWTDLGAGDVIQ